MFATSALSQQASKPVQSSAGPPLLRLLVYCGRKRIKMVVSAILSCLVSRQANRDKIGIYSFLNENILVLIKELSIRGMIVQCWASKGPSTCLWRSEKNQNGHFIHIALLTFAPCK